MKFLVDEGVERAIVTALRNAGYDTTYIIELHRGIADDEILIIANSEGRIIMTRDKDFGDLVYRDKKVHSGIVLHRLSNLTTSEKVILVLEVIEQYSDQLMGAFTVIQPSKVRIRKL